MVSVTIENTVQKSFYLAIYHIILVMFTWSYWQTIFCDIRPVPEKVTSICMYCLFLNKHIKKLIMHIYITV